METSEIGFWMMLAFWGSAIGSIAFGISWARMKGRGPMNDKQIIASLKKRLEKGEISQEYYDNEIKKLSKINK